jgi:hypothetical protein
MLNLTCSKTKRVTPGFFDFLSEWIGEGPFDRDKEKEKIRWKAFFEQRGRSAMAEELHTEIRRAKQAWLNVLQAVSDDPTKQPHSESPISVDIHAFCVGVKKLH